MTPAQTHGRAYGAVPAARCPDCGNLYAGMGLFFLYSEGRGFRCHDCGNALAHEPYPPEAVQQSLVIPAGLEGPRLHERLERLAEWGGMRIMVDSTGRERTIRPESCRVEVGSSLISRSVAGGG